MFIERFRQPNNDQEFKPSTFKWEIQFKLPAITR